MSEKRSSVCLHIRKGFFCHAAFDELYIPNSSPLCLVILIPHFLLLCFFVFLFFCFLFLGGAVVSFVLLHTHKKIGD